MGFCFCLVSIEKNPIWLNGNADQILDSFSVLYTFGPKNMRNFDVLCLRSDVVKMQGK